MKLKKGQHLAYCTNIHRGETWAETFESLQRYTLAVRNEVCPSESYAIGLRLSDTASRELSASEVLQTFRRWLEKHNCYIFTINGFPFGKFHGQRVKEQVYLPDWSSPARLEYTLRLFDLLAVLSPPFVEGSVSTLPGSFKEFIRPSQATDLIRENLWKCVEYLDHLKKTTGRSFHLGVEPEPLGLFETTAETIEFFKSMQQMRPRDERLLQFLGVNYDTCHLAVEFENATESLSRLRQEGIRISKIHLSSALKVKPTAKIRQALEAFADDIYLHQVVARAGEKLRRYKDLDQALKDERESKEDEEWRIHFHIPLHADPNEEFDNTREHLLETMDYLAAEPGLCSHLEMETYTWEVLPPALKNRNVVAQLVAEYQWCLRELRQRGLA